MKQTSTILKRALCAASTMALLSASPVAADNFANVARVDVIPGWQTASGTHMAGVRVTLAPGWKTYWRAPGDAGIPPRFSWAGSENIANARFHWPTPEVLEQNDLQAIGYADSLVLPIELSPSASGQPMTMAGEVVIGVCEDVCIPMTFPFNAALPPDGRRDGAITASLLNQPLSADELGMPPAICEIAPSTHGLEVTAELSVGMAGTVEAVVIESGNPQVWVSPTDITHEGDNIRATVDMIHVASSSFALDRSDVRITVLGSDYAVDVQGCSAG